MPHSRPLPAIGPSCHELRIRDRDAAWRIVYFVGAEAIVILDVFAKTTRATPKGVLDLCSARLAAYARLIRGRGSP